MMTRPSPTRLALSALLALACGTATAWADPRFAPPATAEGRLLAFISDLHMSWGKVGGRWHHYEDFRWPNALQGLLDHLEAAGEGHTDLVIVGDFLELWQLPDDIACRGQGSELGCTPAEMAELTRRVIDGHAGVFEMLKTFSRSGENRLHALPGNHDAALLLPEVWSLVADALGAESGRVRRADDGFFVSADGFTVVEHGHQIPGDANRYASWPEVRDDASGLIQRPFGELFVQRLFNETERHYPIIDNLAPEVAGAWYRAQDRGVWGSVGDFARFIAFALFETSLTQKLQFLGPETAEERGDWDVAYARQELGHELFAYAMPPGEPLRAALLSDEPAAEVVALQAELDALAVDPGATPEAQIRELCDLTAANSEQRCRRGTLGEFAGRIPGVRPWLVRQHLIERRSRFPEMVFFVYGHTHKYEQGHRVTIEGSDQVVVYNTGAFQRLIGQDQYLKRLAAAHPGVSPAEGLSKLTPEDDFEPCYTVVLAPWSGTYNQPMTWWWHMPEDGEGSLIEPGEGACG